MTNLQLFFLDSQKNNSGRIDLVINPNIETRYDSLYNANNFAYMNYTKVQEIAPNKNFAPRKYIDGEFSSANSSSSPVLSGTVLFVNNKRENEIGLSNTIFVPLLLFS